jgi:hypothetical protein
MREREDARRFSERIHAVVVGVSEYAGSGLADLPACRTEAAQIAGALSLSRTCGVPGSQIHLIPDSEASRARILDTLMTTASKMTSEDVLIFYFAGHGENDGDGFVLRTGPRTTDAQRGLSREDVSAALSTTQARGVLVILDCCGGVGFAENAPEFFFSLGNRDFRLLISASRAGQSSWELGDRGHSFRAVSSGFSKVRIG